MGWIIAGLIALFGVYSDIKIHEDQTDKKIIVYKMPHKGAN